MTLYKTKNRVQTGFVPGVGPIVDGKIETDQILEGNFEEVTEQPQTTAQVAAPAAPPVSPPPVQPPTPPAQPNPQPVQNTNNQTEIN